MILSMAPSKFTTRDPEFPLKHSRENQSSSLDVLKLASAADTPVEKLRYHAYSVWLFTFSDLKTIVIPSTAFAILHGLAVLRLGLVEDTSSSVLYRTPLALIWTWINLLPFAIDNQRQKSSIDEDYLNKPWRTMPSERMTQQQAKMLMLAVYPLATMFSVLFGGLAQSLTLMFLGAWYNGFGGADFHYLVRNFINACGFICFASGALDVIIGHSGAVILRLAYWFFVIGGIVLSTVQTQDMYDQAGDWSRGRRTMPLVIGDCEARWVIASALAFWSLFSPWLWCLSVFPSLPSVSLGFLVAGRCLWKRTAEADKNTFRLWNLWLVSLYFMPLQNALSDDY